MKDEEWPCEMDGRINIQSGAVRVVRRRFNGAGDVRAAALAELHKRKDGGAPWYGDAVRVITPLGHVVIVDVPYPEGMSESS